MLKKIIFETHGGVLRMNKTIKKIVALSTGAIMLAGTGAMALGATLADYPSPFVVNGAFVGKIVIGEKAAAVDTLGSMDIAASLQRSSSTSAGTGTGTSTASTEDGYKFSESHDLVLGDELADVTTVVDDGDLPKLLKSGTVEADDGTEYDYDVEIDLPASSGTSVSANIKDNNLDEKYNVPMVYYDLGTGAGNFYDVLVDFTDSWSLNEDSDDDTGINEGSAAIDMFGRSYTFDPNNYWDDDTMVLFGSDSTLTIKKGEVQTITYNGKDYSVEVLGANSDDSTAILRVGSETRSVKEGDSRTVGGLPVYIKDVFISNVGGAEASVQIFLGSNKIEIEYATSGGEVKLNGKVLDEVTVAVDRSGTRNWESVNSLTFSVVPQDTDPDEVEYILPGKDYVDPLFGAFKFHFVGADDLMKGKEMFSLEQSAKKLNVVFTPKGASKATTLTVLEDDDMFDDFFNQTTLTNLQKDDIFLYNEFPGDADKAVTHVLQVSRVKDGDNMSKTDSYEIKVKDLTFDNKEYAVTKCKALDSKIALYPVEGSGSDYVTFTDDSDCEVSSDGAAWPTVTKLYTNAGASVQFYRDTANATTSASQIQQNTGYLYIDEDAQDDDDSSASTAFLLKYAWDSDDDAYSTTVQSSGTAESDIGDDDNILFYLSEFGTYIVEDKDSTPYRYVKMYIPDKEVTYDMFLLPVDSTVTVTSTSGGGAVALNPIAVGMAVLDSEATLGSKPYIVVGGPCANTVASALMGSPVDCVAGFVEGTAMIKLYSEQNALLVAGYSGKDTQGASRVLANYKDYAFSGTELKVTTANLASLSVTKVN